MTNEEVLNIVKLKYPEAKLTEDGRIIIGEAGHYEGIKFVAEFINCIENNKIIFCHRQKNCLGYIMEAKSNVEYEFKNIIELKHILKLDITREDIILYLTNKFGESYSITDGVVGWMLNVKNDLCDDFIVEIDNYNNSLILEGSTEVEDGYVRIGNIFNAGNSNEYWRLYNIINNLIGESNDKITD